MGFFFFNLAFSESVLTPERLNWAIKIDLEVIDKSLILIIC